MNSAWRRLLALADQQRARYAMAVVFAAILCLVLLAHSVGWLTSREPTPRAPATIDMRLVELPPPAAPISPVPQVTHAPAAPPPAAKHPVTRSQPLLAHAVPPHNPMPAAQPHEDTRAPTQPAPHEDHAMPATQTPAALSQGASSTTAPSNGTASAAPAPPSGSTQARLLSQPMPVLPDDLREQGYQVTAIAHFKVHTDGTFEVELVKPTQNPRLNQILLETLHRWRFFPAMENGHPVESDQDVRVHFSVS